MTIQTPPTTRADPQARPASPLQNRLLARLIGAISGITEALIPIVDTVTSKPTHPWTQRMRYASRFWAIIRELLILTTRIQPEILSKTPSFPPTRPKPPYTATPRQAAARTPAPIAAAAKPTPQTPLKPRQLAQRLAALLQRLECLAAEAGAALTAPLRRHAALARALTGCDHCPPASSRSTQTFSSWERAG